MAVGAFRRGAFVDHDFFAGDQAGLNVAFGARDVGVTAGQGEVRFCVVIESGWHPALRVVAVGAMCLIVLGEELGVVRVVMAGFALCRGALEA